MTRRVQRWAFALIGLLGLLATTSEADESRKTRIIIDADTANEIDDFYAIVRGLLAPEFRF